MVTKKSKSKWTKVGAVMKGEKNNYVILGNTRAKKDEYNFNVTITVTDMEGNVKAEMKNGILNAFNPRNREGASERNIPESLLAELFIIENT